MAIRTNRDGNSFKVNTEIEPYPIANEIVVKRGDLLRFITINNAVYVTNVFNEGDRTDAIAIVSGSNLKVIPCYILTYRNKYRDLKKYPYVVLSQFTNRELKTLAIKTQISTLCSAISNNKGELISRYNCDNLNQFGVRINPLEREEVDNS